MALNSVSAQKGSGGGRGMMVWRVTEIDITGIISSDSRLLSYIDWGTGDLALRDLVTGKSHILTRSEYPAFAFPSIPLPDSEQVAYGWTEVDGSSDLCLINLDSTRARVIYHAQKSRWIEPRNWPPDGNCIVAALFR